MKQSNYDLAAETIGRCVYAAANMPSEDSPTPEALEAINNLIRCADRGYVLIEWPESQELMEEEWFENEAILALGAEEKTGGSAYFVPIKRVV